LSRALAVFAAAVLAAASIRAEPPVTLSDGRYAMGTVLEITLVAPDRVRGRALLERLYAESDRIEKALSNWDPESDVSRLNRAAGQGPQRVDPELARVLADSIDYARRTRGSFDVTVGPLVALWRAAATRGAAPSEEEIVRARSLVGAGILRADAVAARAELRRPGAAIELGGIAKGHALDRMAALLRAEGIERALLSFGQSSLWALGTPPDEPGWRLLVRGPDGGFAGVATLRERAVSVSGSLGQAIEVAGHRYGHVLDPRSGRPLERPAQAMVLAPSAALAEALSKALLVLGEREGLALIAAEPGCEAVLIDATGRRPGTPGWQAATAFEPAQPELVIPVDR
jgi:thiamine biosynthesis lipoprotein